MEKLHFATPGEILIEEFLKSYNVSVEQLIEEINLPEKTADATIDWEYRLPKGEALAAKTIPDLIDGKIEITPNIAERLAHYFGTSCEFWLNLQKEYNKRR
jgi:plasmid maintenance system antidote protein VapI